MRGAPGSTLGGILLKRIIPADAGSTDDSFASIRYDDGDHPRGCGEHDSVDNTYFYAQGSSPRMRGAPAEATTQAHIGRIIPADAGSTGSCA